jgi:hypothetical protein
MDAKSRSQSEYFRGTMRSYDQNAGLGFIEPDENQGISKLLIVVGAVW